MGRIRIKRIYDEPEASDGFRVLVDRVWPRGMTKERAALHLWMKSIAPSDELRRWYGHDPRRWDKFRTRYRSELRGHGPELRELRARASKGGVTLLYSARNTDRNQAVVLKELLSETMR